MASPAHNPLAAVPSLDAVAADPHCLSGLSRAAVSALLMRTAVVQSALTAALDGAPDNDPDRKIGDVEDRLLDVKEAAARLSLTVDYLYRHGDTFPFTVRVAPGQVRFSSNGISRFILARQGRKA